MVLFAGRHQMWYTECKITQVKGGFLQSVRIYLIRHGKTQANLDGLYAGVTDFPLCESGAKELQSLKEQYEYPDVGTVFVSPLSRAVMTAELLFPEAQLVAVEDFREYDFGEFECKSIADLSGDPRYHSWMQARHSSAPPGGEQIEAFFVRCRGAFCGAVDYMMKNKLFEAAIVTHGGVLQNILGQFVPRSPGENFSDFIVGNGRGAALSTNAMLWMRGQVCAFEGFLPPGAPLGAFYEGAAYHKRNK